MADPVLIRPDPQAQLAGLIFAVLLVDPELQVAEANHASEVLFGRSAKRMVGQHLFDLLPIEDQRLTERLSDNEEQLLARGVALRLGGDLRVLNLTASPLATHPGWRVLTFSDAKPSESEAHELEDAELRAPAILAHEIKNPLSAIRGAGQLIARKLEEKDRPLTRMIADEVDRIARLIDRMQQLGSRNVEPVAPVNLHEVVRRAMASVRAATPDPVEIVEEFDPSLPAVLANSDALEQVLVNLISNARDACIASENPAVTVTTRFVSGLVFNAIRLGRSIRLPIEIIITDNGPGIDPSVRAHIFEPFVTTKKSGQGLGLALVRKMVRDMDGRIHHERDEKAALTHFRIHLPVAP
ncbi:two-component system sensor histidine kinase NtrB [Altererythrobacter sp. MF3-039]|uniref:two-component system sensor histidine kinase NtrB n=1 Tax=Altererythrobacter sp. MF3-039 TaxID=3252901 RepID=UPI00390C7B5A